MRRAIVVMLVAPPLVATALVGWMLYSSGYPWPPDKIPPELVELPHSISIWDRRGRVIDYVSEKPLSLPQKMNTISPHLSQFVVLAEDSKFYQHKGFDVDEIKKSIEKNLEKKTFARGGSTISQQVVKNYFLDKQKNLLRKFYEIPWTKKLEDQFSKKQILELYLNGIEWGPGLQGVEAAARHFFDKRANELSEIESLYLAMIIPNPVRFDVFANPKQLNSITNKKNRFLDRLVSEKKISSERAEDLKNTPFPLRDLNHTNPRFPLCHWGKYTGHCERKRQPHVQELRNKLVAHARSKKDIYTTLDLEIWNLLQEMELEDRDDLGDQDHVVLIYDHEDIVAFRWLPSGKGLVMEYQEQPEWEHYHHDYLPKNQFQWRDLIK